MPFPSARFEWARGFPSDEPAIRGIRYDSRKVLTGDLFFALRGVHFDGLALIGHAIELDAVALLVETLPATEFRRGVLVVHVRDTRDALATIAAHFFGHPDSTLALVGVTGTNSKIRMTYLVDQS